MARGFCPACCSAICPGICFLFVDGWLARVLGPFHEVFPGDRSVTAAKHKLYRKVSIIREDESANTPDDNVWGLACRLCWATEVVCVFRF
jgi:hypothetical protein